MTHYDITIGHYFAKYAPLCKDIVRDIPCEVTMGNEVAMCTYHGIMMLL